jgi:uncharacterized protein YxeA
MKKRHKNEKIGQKKRTDQSHESDGLKLVLILVVSIPIFLITSLGTISNISFFVTANQTVGNVIEIEARQHKSVIYYHHIGYLDKDGNQKKLLYKTAKHNLKVGEIVKVYYKNDRASYFDFEQLVFPLGWGMIISSLGVVSSIKSLLRKSANSFS